MAEIRSASACKTENLKGEEDKRERNLKTTAGLDETISLALGRAAISVSKTLISLEIEPFSDNCCASHSQH